MTTPTNSFGPWTTSLGNASRIELSAFWSHRMNALASLVSTPQTTRRSAVLIGATAVVLAGTPLIDFHPIAAVAQEAPSPALPLDELTSRATPATEAERSAMDALYRRARELEQELAKSHGYRLEPGELVKFVPVTQGGDVRRELAKLHTGERQTMMRFYDRDGELTNTGANYDAINLADLIEIVARVKLHRIEGDLAILELALTGDLIFSGKYDPNPALPTEKFKIDEALVDSLATTLSAATNKPLKFTVRTVDRPVLVARGDYHFTAIPDADGKVDRVTGNVAEQADGTFQFPARRDSTTGRVGPFNEFLEDIGELLLMPIVDEVNAHPTKRSYFWSFPKRPVVEGRKPLEPKTADDVIAALAKQTGLTLTRETRPVQILVIDAAERAEESVE